MEAVGILQGKVSWELKDRCLIPKNLIKQSGSIYVCSVRGCQISASLAFKVKHTWLIVRKMNVKDGKKDRFRDRFSKLEPHLYTDNKQYY